MFVYGLLMFRRIDCIYLRVRVCVCVYVCVCACVCVCVCMCVLNVNEMKIFDGNCVVVYSRDLGNTCILMSSK